MKYILHVCITLLFIKLISSRPNGICDVVDNNRFDCFPDPNANENSCIERGCCWKPAENNEGPPLNVPYCYYGNGNFGYKVCGREDTETGFLLNLCLEGHGGQFGRNIELLSADFRMETHDRLRVKVRFL